MKQFINKWIMRVKESRTVLTVALWGVMAVVQVLGFLRPYLNQLQLIGVAASMIIVFGIAFPYWYDKTGAMKGEQMQRIRRKDNFVGEGLVLNHLGMIHFFSEAFDKDKDEMLKEYGRFVENYRNGVHLEEIQR